MLAKQFQTFKWHIIISFFIWGLLFVVMIVPAVLAQPQLQNGADFPTPTLSPVSLDMIPVERVGGAVESKTYPAEVIGPFEISETTATSNYPHGAIFTVAIHSELAISNVTLFVRYPHGSGTRAIAERVDADSTQWRALLYDTPGQPPWQEFDFYWSITATNGEFAETTSQFFVYDDPTRVWFKSETPLLRLYWFGYDESFGQVAQEAVYAVRERHEQGFGRGLTYTPIAVLFPDLTTFAEFQAGGESGVRRRAGFTSNDLGMTVQRFLDLGNSSSCPLYPHPEEQTLEWLYDYTATVITHEITHLYQYDNNIIGPTWFIEGGATWFSSNPLRGRQEGLRDRAPDDDLPTLQGVGPSSSAFTPNGCNALVYWMGTSFHNYIYGAYGMDTIATWYDLVSRNFSMDDALVEATGKTLAELERDWRLYLGLNPEVFVRPTDPYQFPPTPTPFGS
ncbi:MAG: hypothetical protein CUN55_02700 [Phototrophicales bacterium]|nr:MAG: hypothetical protein CUN55_02700 [Phototrophicales bacterium]